MSEQTEAVATGKHPRLNKSAEAAYAEAVYYEQRIDALYYVTRDLRDTGYDSRIHDAHETIRGALLAKLVDAYSKVFMWGSIIDGPARRRAKRLAHQRFLADRHSLAPYLNNPNGYPGHWTDADEAAFRAEIDATKQEGD